MTRLMTLASLSTAAGLLIVAACTHGNGEMDTMKMPQKTNMEDQAVATFAGGCFWCMEPPFEKLPGVARVVSGYTGGMKADPTYKEVSAGTTGHAEAIQVHYDPSRIGYRDLVEVFWRNIDPTDAGGQFVDRGTQYRSGIFYHTPEQKEIAEASKARLAASGRFDKPIVTAIEAAGPFYRAEEYHQDYYKKSTLRYKFYRSRSGRDRFLDQAWGDDRHYTPGRPDDGLQQTYRTPDDATLHEQLTPLQYRVTQEDATEPPFKNRYWDNKKAGLYVDIVSGEPLFSSADKFKSGTGWPSFTRPVADANVVKKSDRTLFMTRTEVRSRHGDSHLGHVFNDGPAPTGKRYCINSAALRFIPLEQLDEEGYGEWKDTVQ